MASSTLTESLDFFKEWFFLFFSWVFCSIGKTWLRDESCYPSCRTTSTLAVLHNLGSFQSSGKICTQHIHRPVESVSKKVSIFVLCWAATFVLCQETNEHNLISDKPTYFPHPNVSFDNILQNIIPEWPSRCYHLVLSKQAPRLACFHSRHAHHLVIETHVHGSVLQSHAGEARPKQTTFPCVHLKKIKEKRKKSTFQLLSD